MMRSICGAQGNEPRMSNGVSPSLLSSSKRQTKPHGGSRHAGAPLLPPLCRPAPRLPLLLLPT
eukprot:1156368-Pelagomonas_calceolata.AAC.3